MRLKACARTSRNSAPTWSRSHSCPKTCRRPFAPSSRLNSWGKKRSHKAKDEMHWQFKDSPLVFDEAASVLNIRLANLLLWLWPEGGPSVEVCRQLNGKSRMYTNPEIIDALLEYIGVGWQKVFHTLAENKKD